MLCEKYKRKGTADGVVMRLHSSTAWKQLLFLVKGIDNIITFYSKSLKIRIINNYYIIIAIIKKFIMPSKSI